MDISQIKNIEIIQATNKEMRNYFNKKFLDDLETVQDLKTQCFEIDIKIDELKKTKEIYVYNSTSKKSVFSPLAADNMSIEKGKIIETQIKDLRDVKSTLITRIHSLEVSLTSLKKKLAALNEASSAIDDVMADYNDEWQKELNDNELNGFEIVEEEKDASAASHGYNILMQSAFDDTYISTLIDKHIKEGIVGFNHKLDLLSYLVTTDAARAKHTLTELKQQTNSLINQINDINSKLDKSIDSSKPIWSLLDDFVMELRDKHPESVIDADITCTDYEINLHPVFTINLFKLLNIFFDNIFKHSNANHIDFRLSLSSNVVDAFITDNGVGIDPNYMNSSPWYSNLHKAHEIVYLLGGTLDISGDMLSGTKVRFHFPIQA